MKNYDRIEAYIEGNLPIEARAAFEKELSTNEALAEELKAYQFSMEAIELAAESELANRIASIQKKILPEINDADTETARLISLRRYALPLSIAAAVLILISFFFFRNESMITYQSIAEEEYQFSATLLKNRRPAGGDLVSPFQNGMDLMAAGKFDEAIISFNDLTKVDSLSIEASYYLGHSYYQHGAYEQAAASFREVMKAGDAAGYLLAESQWYFLLSELALEMTDDDFKKVLDQFAKQDKRGERLKGKLKQVQIDGEQ